MNVMILLSILTLNRESKSMNVSRKNIIQIFRCGVHFVASIAKMVIEFIFRFYRELVVVVLF